MEPNERTVLTRLGGGLRRPGPLHRTTRIALSVLLVLSHPLWAATIIVDETSCTLVDAITAANTDTAVGGCSAGSGADTIQLTTDVTLTEVDNDDNGLPKVTSAIAIDGGGFVLDQSPQGQPGFRYFRVLSSGTLTIDHLTMLSGVGIFEGGAISITDGTVELMNCTLANNYAETGGAVFNHYGTLTVTNSTLSGNTAVANEYGGSGWGGAIHNFVGTVNLVNSTLSNNTSAYVGSAVFTYYGSLTMTNVTVTGNSGVGAVYLSTPVTLMNTIVAGNDLNCSGPHPIIDGGGNFADDDSCGPGFAPITPGVDFDTELADNGGPTETHALLEGSVAIDAAGGCGLDTDQRGEPRDDGACDSGSYEYQETDDVPATTVVGLALLLLGVLGTGFYFVRRRATG